MSDATTSANGEGVEPGGQSRQTWLNSIFKRVVVDGCSPTVAAKYGSLVLLEAGVPRDIIESLKIIGTAPLETKLPKFCSQRKFAEIATQKFGVDVCPMDISRAIKAGWLKPAVTGTNGQVNVQIGLMIWEKNQPSTGESDGVSWNAKIEKEKYLTQVAERKKKERDTEREERKFAEEWILTEVHNFWGTGIATIIRQSMLNEHKRFLDIAKQAAKESGIDDVNTEKMQAALRLKLDVVFESWQADFIARAENLEKTFLELNGQRKSELKV
jgi:hypothetical protein